MDRVVARIEEPIARVEGGVAVGLDREIELHRLVVRKGNTGEFACAAHVVKAFERNVAAGEPVDVELCLGGHGVRRGAPGDRREQECGCDVFHDLILLVIISGLRVPIVGRPVPLERAYTRMGERVNIL